MYIPSQTPSGLISEAWASTHNWDHIRLKKNKYLQWFTPNPMKSWNSNFTLFAVCSLFPMTHILGVLLYTTCFAACYAGTTYFSLEVFSLKQEKRKGKDISREQNNRQKWMPVLIDPILHSSEVSNILLRLQIRTHTDQQQPLPGTLSQEIWESPLNP